MLLLFALLILLAGAFICGVTYGSANPNIVAEALAAKHKADAELSKVQADLTKKLHGL